MRILIISSGLKPERFGGLPSHVEDLLKALVEAGQEVAYLNTGAKSRWPFTRAWKREGLLCPAWNLSSKLSYAQYWTGSFDPQSQITVSRAYRRAFLTLIDRFKPDLVHVHELTGFPVALFQDLRHRTIRTIFSAHDFYVLCPTVKLFRPDHSFCDRTTEQLDCHACSVDARRELLVQWEYANDQWLSNWVRARNLGRRLIRLIERFSRKPALTQLYIGRRQQFEQIFREVDVVLSTSRAQQRIFEERTAGWHIRFLQLTRSTVRSDCPNPRLDSRSPGKLVFVALNIVNPAKGLSLLEQAFGALHKDNPGIELHLYGTAEGSTPGIRYFGPYDDHQLDEIIAQADFGLLPSLWPEAFGYVGPEMLSRGLPVLATNQGAMPDYVIHGVNGMLFDPEEPNALENCVRELAKSEPLRRTLWQGAASGERHYLSMGGHTEKLLEIYQSLMGTSKNSATHESLPLRLTAVSRPV
jgi:glycosyltransferase involved in cell wall biosynthesis